ncbi:MAG: hypothetical protein HQL15_00425 [Candidatus Omnitrophica bacterium]|nr:hypothetical protein [Candidatus Omnitrophota bacterium]
MFEDGSPVRHKTQGYEGVIDGKTSIKEFFTGNKNVPSQYRIHLINSDIRKIAPEEDLEALDPIQFKHANPISQSPENPTKFKSKSFLMEAGYTLQLNAAARRSILTRVVSEYNLYKVVSFLLRSTIFNRTGNSKRVDQNMRCLREWGSDVDWMMENLKESKNFSAVEKLVVEMKGILEKRGYSWK